MTVLPPPPWQHMPKVEYAEASGRQGPHVLFSMGWLPGFQKQVLLFKTGTLAQKIDFCIFGFRNIKYKKPDPVYCSGPGRKRKKNPKTRFLKRCGCPPACPNTSTPHKKSIQEAGTKGTSTGRWGCVVPA